MGYASPSPGSGTVDAPSATLEEVDIRSELAARPHRSPNYAEENRAFGLLAAQMAENPRNVLQKLAEIAIGLCQADTAGISLLDDDHFRWEAVAGVFAGARGGTMPRDESPCGVCIDRDATQLMHLADRCFPALIAEPRFVEALLIPFHDRGRPIGTVWIVSHSFERKFDREDERILSVLARFASAGWQLWKAGEAADHLPGRARVAVHEFDAVVPPRIGTQANLFWSKHGDVACSTHAPEDQSERWQSEGWRPIPDSSMIRRGLSYQCPHCAPDGRRHRHVASANDAP